MMRIDFSKSAIRSLDALQQQDRERIIKKLEWFSLQTDPLHFAKPLVHLPPATHRFRIGDYRITFRVENNTLVIYDIDPRGQAYR